MRRGLAIGIAAVLLLAGCSSEPPPEPTPVIGAAQGKGFILAMALPADRFADGVAIEVRTTLTWVGPAPTGVIWGSGSGTVTFSFAELTGRHRSIGAGGTDDCARHEFAQGVATPIPFGKSGGWGAEDPDARFYEAYFRDPQLHLPPGRWRIIARANGFLADCAANAPELDLQVALEFAVG